ncbi:uncharacterized protein TNCV_2081771 [Trichonephila clavipes]|nr:uncharacterized protein TNCV_2081771 [Trichonephila clavipes]
MLNDDEIVTSVQAEFDLVDDEMDENEDNNNESSKGPSTKCWCAFSALETAMEWYEQQSECSPTQLPLLKRIRDLAAKKRRCTMESDRLILSLLLQAGQHVHCHRFPYVLEQKKRKLVLLCFEENRD